MEDIEADYLIVGGGVTGVSLAYFLAKSGAKNIVLIEKNMIASGATGKAAGSLVLKGELDILQIIDIFGKKKGLLYWKANQEAFETIKNIVRKEKIKCDFDLEDTVYGSTHHEEADVLEEYIAGKDFEKSTDLLVGAELQKIIQTPLFKYATVSKNHGISVNPLQFTQNLSKVTEKYGAEIYEHTPLIKIEKNTALTPKSRIKFKKLILAMDAETRSSKIRKIASTIIVTKRLTKTQLKSIRLIPKKIVWDSKDIYHYLKITEDNRILLGYGDKHVFKKHTKIDPHEPHFKRIKDFLLRLFPQISPTIEYAWTGSFGSTKSKVPLIQAKGNKIIVGGAASQIACVMAAKHIAHKLLGKHTGLDDFFEN